MKRRTVLLVVIPRPHCRVPIKPVQRHTDKRNPRQPKHPNRGAI